MFLMMPLFQVKNALSVLKIKKAHGEEAQSCLSLTSIHIHNTSHLPKLRHFWAAVWAALSAVCPFQ